MIDDLQISQMTREEKLRAMEALWADLASQETEVESPLWHREALEETAARLASGAEQVLDWEEAKRQIRKRFE